MLSGIACPEARLVMIHQISGLLSGPRLSCLTDCSAKRQNLCNDSVRVHGGTFWPCFPDISSCGLCSFPCFWPPLGGGRTLSHGRIRLLRLGLHLLGWGLEG